MKKIVIFGTGTNTNLLLKFGYDLDFEVVSFIDNYKVGQQYQGKHVFSPEVLCDLEYDEIFVPVALGRKQIISELRKYNKTNKPIRDVCYLNEHYMLNNIEKFQYVFFTDDTDYLNIPYKNLREREDVTERAVLSIGDKWEKKRVLCDRADLTFIFRSHCFELYKREQIYNYFGNCYLNAKMIFLLSDMCEGKFGYMKRMPGFSVKYIKEQFDYVVTYHSGESKKFGFIHYEFPFYKKNLNLVEPQYDLFFVGNAKNRLQLLHELLKKANAKNITCAFWIYGVDDDEMLPLSEGKGIIYNQRLKYDEYLQQMMKCKCIVDICQKNDETTLRYNEAFAYNKKLLTNDWSCSERSTYKEKNVQIFNSVSQINFEWINEPIQEINYEGEFSATNFIDYLKIYCKEGK